MPRPIPACYWVVPGRLLAGEHPGSRSRADALDRLRSFLDAGVTCFVDLTEPKEMPSYEALLPPASHAGRRVEYLRLPIIDHGIPASRDDMSRIVARLDQSLQAGHVVYVHCRAGIGRSAMVIACWLADRANDADHALEELQVLWRQAAQSRLWPRVPETDEQEEFVRQWRAAARATIPARQAIESVAATRAERIRGALLGLALGDAIGAGQPAGRSVSLAYTQHTSLALCLAASLLDLGRSDARDQLERYLRWQREGYLAATGEPGAPSADIAQALGNYLWRRLPMAGSHDPRDRSTASLSRAVVAALYHARDAASGVALAGESSRTTHQSPLVIDACRLVAAMIVTAVDGGSVEQVLDGVRQPGSAFWSARPLRKELATPAPHTAATLARGRADPSNDVVSVLACVRAAVFAATDFESAVRLAGEGPGGSSVAAALSGAIYGALHGLRALPASRLAALAGAAQVDRLATELARRDERVVQ